MFSLLAIYLLSLALKSMPFRTFASRTVGQRPVRLELATGNPSIEQISSASCSEFVLLQIVVICLFVCLFVFRETGREGEKEGKKHQCAVSFHMLLTGDLACNPSMCPDWESNQQPFGLQAGTQSTELHQPGPVAQNLVTSL